MANPLHDHPRSPKTQVEDAEESTKRISRGKRWGEDASEEERNREFKAKPEKEVDGRRFENVDPRKEWDSVPAGALPKYNKKHYDEGGDYDHWDEDKNYWRLKKDEKPTS